MPGLRDQHDHVLVVGLGGVALRTIEQLLAVGVPVAVVDDGEDPRRTEVARGWGVPVLPSGLHLTEALQEAGLAGARAVVCAEDKDLQTLEAALAVHDLRDDVPVVVHLDNPAVGRAIEEVTGRGSVLDVAGLFAPSVIDECLGRQAHTLDLAGERFMTIAVQAPRVDSLRALYGDLVPIAVVPAAGHRLSVCPGRDEVVAAGDEVTLLGTPAELEEAGIHPGTDGEPLPETAAARLGRRARAFTADVAAVSDRAVRATLAVTGLMVLVSVVVLKLFYATDGDGSMSLLQAIYFTFETAATVGFGDFSFANQGAGLQIFAIGLIVAGTLLVSLLFALLTNALVARRIEQSLGRGQLTGMSGHVVLIGLGSVGMRVLEGLAREGRTATVVERDPDNRYIGQARALGIPVVVGDATLGTTLDMVNLAEAGAVAVMTSDDLTNLEAGLAIRDRLGERWHEVPLVVRVFDRALGHRLRDSFGFRHVWSTSAIASPWFVGAVLGFQVLTTFYVENEPFLVARLTVRDGGGLDGLRMVDLSARIRVIALARGEGRLEHPPRRDTRLEAGDRAFLAGPYEELLALVRRDLGQTPVSPLAA